MQAKRFASAAGTRGRCPLDSCSSPERRPARTAAGLRPAPAPLRRAPEGAALWTPAGALAPDPEMLSHLPFACGRDGGLVHSLYSCITDRPTKRRAGRSGDFPNYPTFIFWPESVNLKRKAFTISSFICSKILLETA